MSVTTASTMRLRVRKNKQCPKNNPFNFCWYFRSAYKFLSDVAWLLSTWIGCTRTVIGSLRWISGSNRSPRRLMSWKSKRQEHVNKAVTNFTKRSTACVAANAGHFEHLQYSVHLQVCILISVPNKKLSYRRESVHLTSLYRTVRKAFRYVEPFKGVRINYRQC